MITIFSLYEKAIISYIIFIERFSKYNIFMMNIMATTIAKMSNAITRL